MKFTIFIISILLLLAVSTQGGTLRKKSLEQRAHALKALVATSTPEDIKLSTIRSELRELVAAFTHEKTLLRGLAAVKCHANVTEKILISDVMKGGYNTTDVNVACGKNTLFGKDIRRLHEIMIQCPLVIADYNMLHAKIWKTIAIAEELKKNYTKAKKNFEDKHGFILHTEEYHGSVVIKVLDGLIKRVDIFVKNNSTLGVDATPEAGTNAISAQPAPKTEANAGESLLEVNPESNGKSGIKQLQWLLQRLHERMTVKWEGERNQTAPLKAMWAKKEAKYMDAVDKIVKKQDRLMNIEKERKKWMDICSCKTRTGMGNFDSIDPAVYQVMSAKSLITDIDKNDIVVEPQLPSEKIDKDNKTEPSSPTVSHGHTTTGPATQAAHAETSNSVCSDACDTKNQYCNTETKKCQDKLNDNKVCTKDENCYHICKCQGTDCKCQAEKIVGESCTENKECTNFHAYCDITAKECKYRHVKHMVCTNDDQVMADHYCQGGYVHEYKVEGEQCDNTENQCDERKSTCTNNVCKAKAGASFLEVLAAPLFLDEAFRPEICVVQALNYTNVAVRNAVQTHNNYVEQYKVLEQNFQDMRDIAGNLSNLTLPKMILPTLKAVDEVFDDTLMHQTMLAESDTQSWRVTQKDYFHDFKRYYKFKPVGKTQKVELTFETIDLECNYNKVIYYESDDCDDNAAKEAMFKKDALEKAVCNTVRADARTRTQGPVELEGKCIYVKLYSDFLVDNNSYELHKERNFKGVIANYKMVN